MIDRIDKIRTLTRLRRRDVERCASKVADAARAAAEAEGVRERADAALARATRRHDEALAKRLRAPCDTLVGIFCRGTEAALDEARARLAAAEDTLHQAREESSEQRRRLLRAQARSDALEAFLSRALARHRRAADRRLTDDRANDHRLANRVAFA